MHCAILGKSRNIFGQCGGGNDQGEREGRKTRVKRQPRILPNTNQRNEI